MPRHQLTVRAATWTTVARKDTGEELTAGKLQNTPLELQGAGKSYSGIAVGQDADDVRVFIRASGTVEQYAIWNFNQHYHNGCITFTI